jgi:hypothetical protein
MGIWSVLYQDLCYKFSILKLVVFLDSYVHRAEVRAALAGNQDWFSQYFGKILPMMQKQDNVGLTSISSGTPNVDVLHPEGKGIISF